MFSIYSTFTKDSFFWKDVLENWLDFQDRSGQIVIAVEECREITIPMVRKECDAYLRKHPFCKTRIDLLTTGSDPRPVCNQPHCIPLDHCEILLPLSRQAWDDCAHRLDLNYNIDGYTVPNVELLQDVHKYGGKIGEKLHLHRNRPEKPMESLVTQPVFMLSGLPVVKTTQLQYGNIPLVYNLSKMREPSVEKAVPHHLPIWREINLGKSEPKRQLEQLAEKIKLAREKGQL